MAPVSEIRISRFTEEGRDDWDAYVKNSTTATFFHLIGWRYVLKKTFGYKAYYLYAEYNKKICGILPLFVMRNLTLKKSVVSIPFGVYGGPCADDEVISNLLLEEAKRITQREGADYLELKNITQSYKGLVTKDLYVGFIKELPKNKEECLNNQPRKTRAASRKAINFGLTAEIGIHLLKECHYVYAVSVRNLGSPVVPFEFFKNIAEVFKDNVTVLSVKYNNKIIASVFTYLFKDTIMPYYGGSLHQYLKCQPNNFMYLKLMEYGVEKGCRYFDFGRSKKGSGSYKFKEYFGFEPTPLHYQYFLNKANQMPNLSPVNPKYKLLIKMWKKMPVSFTKFVGPIIIRYIG